MNPNQEPILDPIELTVGQKFEIEKMSRVIDSTTDVKALQSLSKQLLQAWMIQKASTLWIMKQNLKYAPPITTLNNEVG
jgi:hypothetical protein